MAKHLSSQELAENIYKKYHKKYPLVELSSVKAQIDSDLYYESWGLDCDTDWEEWFKSEQQAEEYYDSWLDD